MAENSTTPVLKEEGNPAIKEGNILSKSRERSSQKWVITLFFIVFSLITLFFVARYLVPQALVYLTKAARTTKYSLANSYVFGAPLAAKADGKTKVRISAFLLDNQGLGVADKSLSLNVKPKTAGVSGNVQIIDVQPITDKFGKATFEVVSSFPGQFVVTAAVDGVEFPQSVTVTFR